MKTSMTTTTELRDKKLTTHEQPGRSCPCWLLWSNDYDRRYYIFQSSAVQLKLMGADAQTTTSSGGGMGNQVTDPPHLVPLPLSSSSSSGSHTNTPFGGHFQSSSSSSAATAAPSANHLSVRSRGGAGPKQMSLLAGRMLNADSPTD